MHIQRVAFAHTYNVQCTSFVYHGIFIGYAISTDVYAMYIHWMLKCLLGIIGCENGEQAERLRDRVVKNMGSKYDIQSPKKRKLKYYKVKIFDVDNVEFAA